MALFPELKFSYASQNYEAVLEHAPDGWDEGMVRWERNKNYYGMFRSFTIPLKFVKEGARYLRDDFYSNGFNALCTLTIQKLDRATGNYYTAFTGEFDFTTFKDEQNYVEISLIDRGLAKYLKDNESVEYLLDSRDRMGYVSYGYKPIHTHYDPYFGDGDTVSDIEETRISEGETDIGFETNAYFNSMSLMVFLRWIVDKMTGGGIHDGIYAVKSDILSQYEKYITLTNGKAIRLNQSPAIFAPGKTYWDRGNFKTTFKDFFKSLDSILHIGIGIEMINGKETLVVERRDYFYNKDIELYDLGEVSEFKASVNEDYTFKTIKAGYPEKDLEKIVYGDFEYNVGVLFTSPTDAVKGIYEIVSKYRGDGKGIQVILDNSTSDFSGIIIWDDDTYDDDIFFVELTNYNENAAFDEAVLAKCLMRKNWAPSSQYGNYNAGISPARNLYRHQGFIDGAQYGLQGQAMAFTSGGNDQQHNETQDTQYSSNWFSEYMGWTIGGVNLFSPKYFKPVSFEFETPYPENFASIIGANPKGVIKFTYNGVTWIGFLLSVEAKLAGKSTQKIKLLSSYYNDLTYLIR